MLGVIHNTDGSQIKEKTNQSVNLSVGLITTNLDLDVVDISCGAECDLGVVGVISLVLDFNADVELLLIGLNDKAGMSQHIKTGISEYKSTE